MLRKISALFMGLFLASGTLLAKDTYVFGGDDASHSEIGFKISHWVINKVSGHFDKFEGSILYDEKNLEKSKVDVSIDTASINTRNERRDKHLRSADFFEVEKHPKATFKSKKVEKAKEGDGLMIHGDLSLRGVTKSVVLNGKINGKIEDAYGNMRIGFEGSTKINRKDFGIAWNAANKTGTAMLGDEVEIFISGEGILKK